jgi:hypothetical protein
MLIVRFAHDHVDGKSAARQMVEREDLAREQDRSNKTGPMCYEIAKPFCLHRGVQGDQEPLR